MKRLLLLATITISTSVMAQDSLDFNAHFCPQKKYNQTIVQSVNADINYKGSDDFLQKLKDKGISNLTKQTTNTTTQENVKTQKLINDSLFPLTLEIGSSTDTNIMKYMPKGTIIYGTCKLGATPRLDSMAGNNDDSYIKGVIMSSMQSMIAQVQLPHRKMAIGQTITVTDPLTLPIGGMALNMAITTNYTLKKINNDGTATIAITQSYAMQSDMTNLSYSATGNGSGELTYDTKNNYYKKYNLNLTMKMSAKFSEDASMEYSSNVDYSQTVDISSNK